MVDIIRSDRIAPALPADDYFTRRRKLCAREKHKSELTDDETLMLALAAAQAALAHYWHPRRPISRRNVGDDWRHPRS
jgi:hypothetical protein